jgi:hypothetical protein
LLNLRKDTTDDTHGFRGLIISLGMFAISHFMSFRYKHISLQERDQYENESCIVYSITEESTGPLNLREVNSEVQLGVQP